MAKKLKNSVMIQRIFEKLDQLKQNFDVNFVLVYVYLNHKKTKHISLSMKYQCCKHVEQTSLGNISYSSCYKFLKLHEFAFGSQLAMSVLAKLLQ